METVTLSPKFQVVIPVAVREALGLRGGEKLRVISDAGRVEFIPVRPMKQMRGFPAIEDSENLLVPLITVYEVFKKVLRERS